MSKKIFTPLTDAATITWNVNSAKNAKVTLAGNRTFVFVNAKEGDEMTLRVTQDATGSRTATWPATVRWSGGTAPTLTTTAARTDVVKFIFDGTNYIGRTVGLNYTLA